MKDSDKIIAAIHWLYEQDVLELTEEELEMAPRRISEEEDIFQIDWNKLLGGKPNFDGEVPYGNNNDEPWGQLFPEDAESLEGVLRGRPPQEPPSGEKKKAQWDTCAWYQPIHFYGFNWGIYIKEDCLRRTALEIAYFLPPHSVYRRIPRRLLWRFLIRAAITIYFLHEHYHHRVESMGFRLHVSRRVSSYIPYKKNVYRKMKGSNDQIEETLANAHMMRGLSNTPYSNWVQGDIAQATKEYLRYKIPLGPPAYDQALKYVKEADFVRLRAKLQSQILYASLHPKNADSEWSFAPDMLRPLVNAHYNFWVIVPKGTKSTLPVTTVSPIKTADRRKIIKLITKYGYALIGGGKGSHQKYRHPKKPKTIIIPQGKTLSPGVIKNILWQLGQYTLKDLPVLLAMV